MRISEIMTRDIVALSPSATLQEAARRMREADTGFIPVQEDGKIIGTVTDRDICVRAVAEDRSASSTNLGEVLSKTTVCCYDDEDEDEVARTMAEHKVRRLPVLDRQNNLVGAVSIGDLASRAHAEQEVGEAMEEITKSSERSRSV